MTNALAAGGTVAVPKMAIKGVGWLAYCKDPEGNIFGLMPSNQKCMMHMAIMDRLFTLLRDGGPEVRRVFERWTTVRERPYYIQHD